MLSLLLPVIYLAFISMGLPDSMLGSAWPSMYTGLGVGVSACGLISTIITASTVVSSLLCDRLHARFGTGRIVAVSTGITALSLLGFSLSSQYWMLCLIAVPYGLGAGSIDAVLNNYVALHYQARHMSWLHCMWGVGCSIGPMLMGRALTGGGWQLGYRWVAMIQAGMTLVLFISLGLWQEKPAQAGGEAHQSLTLKQALRVPGALEAMLGFLAYCGMESTTGLWVASYLTLQRGVSPAEAASWASLFYLGITVGRLLCGFLTLRLDDRRMVTLGQWGMLAGIVLLALPLPSPFELAAMVVIGMGCAPVYPSMIHDTPRLFGQQRSQSLIGLQMASAYVGSAQMPPLFGLLGQKLSFGLYPFFLLALLALAVAARRRLYR